jgi:predicted dehydrogenase
MFDQGVYPVSLAQMVFGRPERVTAVGTIEHGVDAEVASILDFPGGARAVCLNGLRAASPLSAYVGGTTGYIDIAGPFWSTGGFIQRGSTTDEFTYEREGSGYVPMLRAINAAILHDRTEHDLRTHADTIAVAETLDKISTAIGFRGA